ncbi:MAG: EscN/YscN/HrcN family type III secretion system ATPase, partial [Planctomycetota bacterium]
MPRLVERLGYSKKGSITGILTVLVENDDLSDPVADSARSLLDGHIVLSRKLAERGHYPAVDVLQSISRLMPAVIEPEHCE